MKTVKQNMRQIIDCLEIRFQSSFGSGGAFEWVVYSTGNVYGDAVDFSYGVRPFISLKSTVELTGNGTMNSPFEVVS